MEMIYLLALVKKPEEDIIWFSQDAFVRLLLEQSDLKCHSRGM